MSASQRPSSDFDVAVIGAGPAGSAAAIAAAQAGARTLLVDRSLFPRAKVCGACLSDAGIAALEALGAERALASATALRSVRVSCGDRALVVARRAGVAVAREALDLALIGEARARGVEVLLGVSARLRPDRAIALTGEDAARLVRARTTIVADGLGGTALEKIDGFGWTVTRRSHMGFGATLPRGAVECGEGEIRLRAGRGGYIGVVRLSSGELDIAAAVDPRALRAAGCVAACARAMLGEDVRDPAAIATARWRGTPLLTRRRARIASEGLLVAGDAAGYVEPFTGEGMTWAITTGAAAGALAAADPCAHRAWPRLHARLVRRSRLRCAAIALLLRSPALLRTALAIGAAAPAPFELLAARIGRRTAVPGSPRLERA